MKTITVVISDDHTVVREGLRALLDASPDIRVLGEAEDGRQSVNQTRRFRPDAVILDLAMPLLNGVEATRRIKKEVPSTKVLILSAYSDVKFVQQAIEAGAAGYLMKETAAGDLLQAVREIVKGNPFFSPLITRRLLSLWENRYINGRPLIHKSPELTNRQMEVVQLIAEGHSSKQMAGLLCISVKTIEKHRQAAMDKLGIHDIATMTRYAVSNGVVELNRIPDWQAGSTGETCAADHDQSLPILESGC